MRIWALKWERKGAFAEWPTESPVSIADDDETEDSKRTEASWSNEDNLDKLLCICQAPCRNPVHFVRHRLL